MSLAFVYYSPTTPGAEGWSVTISTGIALGKVEGLLCEAELGSPGTSAVQIEDATGTAGHTSDAIVGLKQFSVTESACPTGRKRIFTGYTGDRRYRRDVDRGLITGPARLIDVTLADLNAFLGFRILDSFNRPAETDLARVAALLAVDFLSTTLYDEGLIETTGGVAMDACDYTKQKPIDVLNDCAQQSGRNFFVAYNEATGHYQLAYLKSNTSELYEAICSFSNVASDVDDETCFYPDIDAELARDPSRVISGVYVEGANDVSEYVTREETSWEYGWRDAISQAPNVKTSAKAITRGTRYLNENKSEDDKITFTALLPAAHVNDWREGERGQVRFQHLPGYEEFVYVRCLNRTVMQDEETRDWYHVRYEMSPQTIGGLHQVVLGAAIGTAASVYPDTPTPLVFAGSEIATPPLLAPAVQDTDGYAVKVIDGSLSWGYYVEQIVIPPGLGGTYNIYYERFSAVLPYWASTPDGHYVDGVEYESSTTGAKLGADVATVTPTLAVDVLKNGVAIPELSTSYVGTAWVYFSPAAKGSATDVALDDGDVITMQMTLHWQAYGSAFSNCLGKGESGWPGTLVLTKTG